MGRKRIFTDFDISFILENYETLGYEKLGEILGQNAHSIRAIYHRERLKSIEQKNVESIQDDNYEIIDPKLLNELIIQVIKNHRKYGVLCEYS